MSKSEEKATLPPIPAIVRRVYTDDMEGAYEDLFRDIRGLLFAAGRSDRVTDPADDLVIRITHGMEEDRGEASPFLRADIMQI